MNFRKMTPVQKKWTLTTTLLVVLGFNLSAPIKHMSTSGSIELAATKPPLDDDSDDDIADLEAQAKAAAKKLAAAKKAAAAERAKQTTEGDKSDKKIVKMDVNGQDVKVELTRLGNKTRVKLPEGSIESCMKESNCDKFVVDSSMEDLFKIQRAIAAKTREANVAVNDDDDDESDKNDKAKQSVRRGRFDKSDKKDEDMKLLEERVADRCERKEKASEKSKCLSENFVRILRDKSLNISADVALEFFNSSMRGTLKEALMKQNPSDMVLAARTLGAAEAMKGTEMIQKLLGSNGLPSKYNDIRASIANLNKEVLHHFATIAVANQKEARTLNDRAQDLEIRAQMQERRGLQAEARESRENAKELREKYQEVAARAKDGLEIVTGIIQPSLVTNTTLGLQSAVDAQLLEKSSLDVMLEGLREESKMLQKEIAANIRQQNPTPSPVDPSGRIDVTKVNPKGEFSGSLTATPTNGNVAPFRGTVPGQQIPVGRGSQQGSLRF